MPQPCGFLVSFLDKETLTVGAFFHVRVDSHSEGRYTYKWQGCFIRFIFFQTFGILVVSLKLEKKIILARFTFFLSYDLGINNIL